MLRTALALIIAAHGIGHILFLIPLLGIADWRQSTRSWLFIGETSTRLIGSIIWIAAMLAFGITVFGLLGQHGWWRIVAISAAVISTFGLILFWTNPVTTPLVSALIFNFLVLGALLIAHWPSIEAIGA